MSSTVLQELEPRERNRVVQGNLTRAVADLELYAPEETFKHETSISQLRRGRLRRADDSVGMVSLLDVDGVLVWCEGAGGPSLVRRRRGGLLQPTGDIVAQLKFEKLQPNKIGEFLQKLDKKLTPHHSEGTGLRRWSWTQSSADDHKVEQFQSSPVERPANAGRTLLFIHGTFSNGDSLMDQLRELEPRTGFLRQAARSYAEILTFDHPTLAVSPVLNGLDLARLFAGVREPVDVICHSRGGLVARWWLDALGGAACGKRRAVLVGVPLGGTSLASPARLKGALDLLTNVGNVLQLAGASAATWIPVLAFAVGMMKVITSITSLGAHTPLLDAALAMIPGLNCQSRVSNNAELERLRRSSGAALPTYFAIQSDFQVERPGWRFWEYFVHLKERTAALGAAMVFDEPNDLVVDTASMVELTLADSIPADRRHIFSKNDIVHHTNYFQQLETILRIREWLQIP